LLAATTCGGGTIRLREGDYIARPIVFGQRAKLVNFRTQRRPAAELSRVLHRSSSPNVMAEATKACVHAGHEDWRPARCCDLD
jgi:hypothetical protein